MVRGGYPRRSMQDGKTVAWLVAWFVRACVRDGARERWRWRDACAGCVCVCVCDEGARGSRIEDRGRSGIQVQRGKQPRRGACLLATKRARHTNKRNMHNEADTIISTRYCSYNLLPTKRRSSKPDGERERKGRLGELTRDEGSPETKRATMGDERAREVPIHGMYTSPLRAH